MHINATFFVQIINFWITYAVLHQLLFKFFVRAIEKKKAKQSNILSLISEKEKTVALLAQEKKDQLLEFKDYINKRYKLYATNVPAGSSIPQSSNLREKSVDKEKIKDLIIQKVRHGF